MPVLSSLRLGLTVLSFWPFMPIVARAPLYGRLLVELMLDRRVPASRKAIMGFAVAYVVSPIDLVPDFVPFLGVVDDLVLVPLALRWLLARLPASVQGHLRRG